MDTSTPEDTANPRHRVPLFDSDDLIATLEYLNLEPAALVCLSMGASTTVDVAVEGSDLIKGILVEGRA